MPIAAAVMDQVEGVRLLPGPDMDSPAVPAYGYPESAARALGHAARYGAWRATPPGSVPVLEGLRHGKARELVASFLAGDPGGGWLSPVVARPDGALAVDGRVRIQAAKPADAYLRQLR